MSDIINDLTFKYAFRIDPVAEVTTDVRCNIYIPVKLLKWFVPSSYYIVLGYGAFFMPYFEKMSDDKFKSDMAITLEKGDFIYSVSPECKKSYNDRKFELAVESILHITNALQLKSYWLKKPQELGLEDGLPYKLMAPCFIKDSYPSSYRLSPELFHTEGEAYCYYDSHPTGDIIWPATIDTATGMYKVPVKEEK